MGEGGNLLASSLLLILLQSSPSHQFEDLLLHLVTVPSKAHHIEHLIYRILSHVVAFPRQAHHFPPAIGSRDLVPRTALGS